MPLRSLLRDFRFIFALVGFTFSQVEKARVLAARFLLRLLAFLAKKTKRTAKRWRGFLTVVTTLYTVVAMLRKKCQVGA